MAKITNLPVKANPDGTETVLILDGNVAKRVPLAPLIAGATSPAVAALGTDLLDPASKTITVATDLQRGALSRILAIGTDLLLGAASKVVAVGSDLLLGATSKIAAVYGKLAEITTVAGAAPAVTRLAADIDAGAASLLLQSANSIAAFQQYRNSMVQASDPLAFSEAERPALLIYHRGKPRDRIDMQSSTYVNPYGGPARGKVLRAGTTHNLVFVGPSHLQLGPEFTFGGMGYAYRVVLGLEALGAIVDYSVFGIDGQGMNYIYPQSADFPNLIDVSAWADECYDATPGVINRLIILTPFTNDAELGGRTAAQGYADLCTLIDNRRASVWKQPKQIMVSTEMARGNGSFDAIRNAYNTMVANDAGGRGYQKIRFDTDPLLGTNGAQNSTVYFSTDKVHLIDAGRERQSINTLALDYAA